MSESVSYNPPFTTSEDMPIMRGTSWGAILAASAVALAVQIVLNLLGIGIGAAIAAAAVAAGAIAFRKRTRPPAPDVAPKCRKRRPLAARRGEPSAHAITK